MQVRTSKEVTDRQKATAFVQFALRVEGPAVADDMTRLFRLRPGNGLGSLAPSRGSPAHQTSAPRQRRTPWLSTVISAETSWS